MIRSRDEVDVESELLRLYTIAGHLASDAGVDELIELLFTDLDFCGDVAD